MLLAEAPRVYVLIHIHLIHKLEVPINLDQTQMIVQLMQKLYFSSRRESRQREGCGAGAVSLPHSPLL